MKLIKSALLSMSIVAAASAQAVTVFSPTEVEANCGCLVNQTVNLIGQVDPTQYSIYLFGDEQQSNLANLTIANGLELGTYATVDVTETGLAKNLVNGATKQLVADDKFFLALLDKTTNQFVFDNGTSNTIPDITKLSFVNAGTVIAVDVQEVPVPAAAWLFGSAMLGLAGVKRRK